MSDEPSDPTPNAPHDGRSIWRLLALGLGAGIVFASGNLALRALAAGEPVRAILSLGLWVLIFVFLLNILRRREG